MYENIQGNIDLSGRGHTRRLHGDYDPGEFFSLVNCELTDWGNIVTRRPVTTIAEDTHVTGNNNWRDMNAIVGHYKSGIVVSGNNRQGYIGPDYPLTRDNWGAPDVTANLGGNCKWSKLVGFVRYNKINYWLYWSTFDDGATNYWFEYNLYYGPDPAVAHYINQMTLPATHVRVYSTSPTATETTKNTGGFPGTPNPTFGGPEPLVQKVDSAPVFRGMFMHKERMWIVTDKSILFSKATAPETWATPDGGFFNFTEIGINHAVAYKDSVYVIADNSIRVINFNIDPNDIADVTVKEISNSLGGDSAVLVGDVVYFARDNALYSIVGQTVTRVLSLDVKANWDTRKRWKLVAFGKYIIAMYVGLAQHNVGWPQLISENGVIAPSEWDTSDIYHYGHTTTTATFDVGFINGGGGPESFEGDVYYINTETASIHGFSYDAGITTDMYFVPVENLNDDQCLWIMTKKAAGASNTDCQFAIMKYNTEDSISSPNAYDTALLNGNASQVLTNFRIPIWLEVQKYRPDGSVNFMKKFRSLMIEGHLPDNTSVQFNFSESWVNWATASQLANTTSDYAKILPNDLRIPINQRARGLTFRLFRTEATKSTAVNTVQNTLNISRLTTLWSYTGRGPVSNNPTYGRDSQPA